MSLPNTREVNVFRGMFQSFCSQGVSLERKILLGRHPPGQRRPGQRPLDRDPWTETPEQRPLDRDLDRDPLDRDPWTETPGQRPLDRDLDRDPLDRDPLERDPSGQRPSEGTWDQTGIDIMRPLERTWDQIGSDIIHTPWYWHLVGATAVVDMHPTEMHSCYKSIWSVHIQYQTISRMYDSRCNCLFITTVWIFLKGAHCAFCL